jgi:phosphopantothenoylcysteine decarboxylase/phosphopantothenate--cysteine ligase
VTAGPTIEDIDPVRFVSNRSSGRMGYRLAEAARDRGARVVLISGPTSLPAPGGVEVVSVRSAEDMAAAVNRRAPSATIVAMAAAVSDYRPDSRAASKIKKTAAPQSLALVPTTDILRTLGEAKDGRFLIGFAAETEGLLENARKKRREKHLDLMVANDVSGAETGFGVEENAAVLIDDRGETELPRMPKRELAERIWDRVAEMKGRARSDQPQQ